MKWSCVSNNLTGSFEKLQKLNLKRRKSIKKNIIGMILVSQLTLGCSSLNKTVLGSMGVGAAAGALITQQHPRGKSVKSKSIGALAGALISGVVGFFVHKGAERRDAKIRRDTLFNLDKFDVSAPSGLGASSAHGITAPSIESEWIPTRVEGRKLIEGHKVWLITDEAHWVPDAGRKEKSSRK